MTTVLEVSTNEFHNVRAPLLPLKLMSLIGATYGASLTEGGRTQYVFFCVTVSDTLICIPASTAQTSDATCVHESPRPAARLQWAHIIAHHVNIVNGRYPLMMLLASSGGCISLPHCLFTRLW